MLIAKTAVWLIVIRNNRSTEGFVVAFINKEGCGRPSPEQIRKLIDPNAFYPENWPDEEGGEGAERDNAARRAEERQFGRARRRKRGKKGAIEY